MIYFIKWLNDKPNQRLGIRVCQSTIGLVFIFRAITELNYADYLYSPFGIVDDVDFFYGERIANAIEAFLSITYAPHFILVVLGVCGVFYIVNFHTFLVTLTSFIIFTLIGKRNASIGDGGDNLVQLILIYMLFLIPYGKDFKPNSLRVWMHNLGVAAIGAQVMIMYFTAGFYKIMGDVWTGGIALFNISQVKVFSLPIMYEMFKNPYLATLSAYITMLFLIWFPIAMFSKVKLLWIGIGISFHLGIISFMGLITFGVVMIGMELFFITDKEYEQINNRFKYLVAKLKGFYVKSRT